MMKILVTGANGLLGQKLTQLLQQQPDTHPIATARKSLNYTLTKGEFRALDITDAASVKQVIESTRPDVVINTAAMTQVDQCETDRAECWKQNVGGVENLVNALEGSSIHLVHVSTDFIFDGTHGPLEESEKPAPVNYYGESKLAGELLVQQAKFPWTILRTVLVYGITPGMSRTNIVLWVKKSLEDGKKIQVVNDQWRTPTLAEDLAMGCYLAASKKATGIYHISGEGMMTPYDIAIATADFFKLDKSLIQATDSNQFKQPARRPMKTGFIIDKAKRELGYRSHSFQEGLQLLASQITSVA
ncbi:MAG: SDR family oxidoreductase [Bacteroidota bacterium]